MKTGRADRTLGRAGFCLRKTYHRPTVAFDQKLYPKHDTQEQFADLSGFSQQYISSLEQGRRNPTVITLYELAVALKVSHLDLIRPTKVSRRA